MWCCDRIFLRNLILVTFHLKIIPGLNYVLPLLCYMEIWDRRKLRYVMDVVTDNVWMYEEIMMNDDNLESNLPTSSLLKMCSLVQVELYVYCLVAGDELTLSVLCDLTLQVNLCSGQIIHWLPQFTQKYNGMLINSHKSRCSRLRVWIPDNSLLGNSVIMNSSQITILDSYYPAGPCYASRNY